jgi:alpha-glucosidase (family GH31 glycosyl hydrolase)
MRALWLHFPDDPRAVACDDEYLWGGNLLVAPVVEKGAATRRIYLPHGTWYDFWSGARLDGGREISRPVDLETMPLYVRAGSILPLGPVKQYVAETSDQPLSISVYSGTDASFLVYEDDGISFDYRRGEWMGLQLDWSESRGALTLHLADGSHMLRPARRDLEVRLVTTETIEHVVFDGTRVELKL